MPLVTVKDAARLYHRAPGTIRSWISLDRIEGQPDPALTGHRGQRKLYPLDRLQDAYERRASAEQEAITQ
jgi:hypothetical protein